MKNTSFCIPRYGLLEYLDIVFKMTSLRVLMPGSGISGIPLAQRGCLLTSVSPGYAGPIDTE